MSSRSFDGRRFPLHNSPSWILLESVSVSTRPRPNVVHTRVLSPDLSRLMSTNKHNRLVPPFSLIPRSLGFHMRTRVSMRHVCRFYQMCCFRAPRSSRPHSSLHCSSVFRFPPMSSYAASIAGRRQRCPSAFPFTWTLNHSTRDIRVIGSFRFLRPPVRANREALAVLHSQVEMTRVALVGRRWADRLVPRSCRHWVMFYISLSRSQLHKTYRALSVPRRTIKVCV